MKGRDIIKKIEKDGWYLVRTRGSHRQYHHPTKKGTTTVSGHLSDDIPKGLEKSTLKQGWITIEAVRRVKKII